MLTQKGHIKVAFFCIFGKNWYTARITFGPIVYRLGHKLFKLGSGVRLPVGSQKYEFKKTGQCQSFCFDFLLKSANFKLDTLTHQGRFK